MTTKAERTFGLPAEHAAFVDAQVASGAYASAGEVVNAGLRALQERHADVERWMRDDVGPTFDAMREDPARALSARSVFDDVRAHHAARVAGKA